MSAPPTQPAPPAKKTVVEIYPDVHSRLGEAAARTGNSVKRFTTLLLDYALGKFDAGDIQFREPAVEEVESEKEVAP